ncbi:uncharacterized protein LOC106770043 [Vigna radiata var. radiata]|uniref:Uncharacterized protein LOC106770043 n=1 Tax=Vigna radiata var. radiata TaxID=3916 RepID=A0A1S3UZ72_VIGRR|nr:uncharacterized protein LOC106770043 [Vigna radiata var. radiata]
MENQNTKDKVFQKFTWILQNPLFNFPNRVAYSRKFTVDGHTWEIRIATNSPLKLIILVGLGRPFRCEKIANLKFIVINQLNHRRNVMKEIIDTFTSICSPLVEIYAPGDGFIVNDSCIIEVHISVHKSEHEKQVDESVRNIDNKLVQSTDNLSTKKMISNSPGETVDFRGLGKVDNDYIPFLEEVCSRYPSLIDSKKRYIEWSFTTLGRVLHFLNTKKVREMDDDACNHLQTLWEELEKCEFDLSWLKPQVQSALGMKTCVEKVLAVKSLEENVITLEKDVTILKENISNLKTEAKTLKTKMFEAEVKLEITRRELVKAKEGFEECDLEAELIFVKP